MDAYRNRRTYATEDHDLVLSFTVGGSQMGARVPPGTEQPFEIYTENGPRAPKQDTEFTLYRNGQMILRKTILASEATSQRNVWTFNLDTRAGDYFYVTVQQGAIQPSRAWSSPIWIQADS